MTKRKNPIFDSLFGEIAFFTNLARKRQSIPGKAVHSGLTEDKHPFNLKVGSFEATHSQFLFLWALDRMEQTRQPYEMDEKNIGKEMEDMLGGRRTYGLGTIYQMSDEMKALGLTEEKSHRRPDGKNVTTYHLTPQGHLLLGKIYEQNKLKALVPYKGLSITGAVLQ